MSNFRCSFHSSLVAYSLLHCLCRDTTTFCGELKVALFHASVSERSLTALAELKQPQAAPFITFGSLRVTCLETGILLPEWVLRVCVCFSVCMCECQHVSECVGNCGLGVLFNSVSLHALAS